MVYPLRPDKATETSAQRTSISGARMVVAGFETTATKNDLDTLRQEIRDDVDMLLDRHLGTYMKRYKELARRVKRLEETVGIWDLPPTPHTRGGLVLARAAPYIERLQVHRDTETAARHTSSRASLPQPATSPWGIL